MWIVAGVLILGGAGWCWLGMALRSGRVPRDWQSAGSWRATKDDSVRRAVNARTWWIAVVGGAVVLLGGVAVGVLIWIGASEASVAAVSLFVAAAGTAIAVAHGVASERVSRRLLQQARGR